MQVQKQPSYYKPLYDLEYFGFGNEEQETYRKLDQIAKSEFASSV